MAGLNCLPPTDEPRATEHIGNMIGLIEELIAGGFAYAAEGHVLFAIGTIRTNGRLSPAGRRSTTCAPAPASSGGAL